MFRARVVKISCRLLESRFPFSSIREYLSSKGLRRRHGPFTPASPGAMRNAYYSIMRPFSVNTKASRAMGTIAEPRPVKLIAAVMSSDPAAIASARRRLEEALGRVDLESGLLDFDYTEYYLEEMGPGLKRVFLSFGPPGSPERLSALKTATNGMEREISASAACGAARAVNIDPGYVDLQKVVLASTKDRMHRICIGGGIYAEVALCFMKGEFRPCSWTYPDLRADPVREFFAAVREIYRRECGNR